jgi:uroporphyrinogen decarboxylase
MNVRERYLATYRRQPTDRAPIALSYFHAGFARLHLPPRAPGEDPVEAGIRNQLRYGFDPHLYVRGVGRDWFLAQPEQGQETEAYRRAAADWQARESTVQQPGGTLCTDYTIDTPSGALTCVRVQTPDDFGTISEPFIKEEEDIALLRYRPHPRDVIAPELIRRDFATMGDRCWAMASFAGVWTIASFFRGPDGIMYDLYDRPAWVARFLGLLTEYQVELVREVARAGVGVTLRMDSSFVGFGLSKAMYRQFIMPCDRAIVTAAHEAGLRVHLHICGKKNAFLEDLAETGIDALETLTPAAASGDVVLADAKRRIGDRVCLMGGFLSHLLAYGTPQDVEQEVRRCFAAAGQGGGYILSPTGRIDPETPEENLRALTTAGARYGTTDAVGALHGFLEDGPSLTADLLAEHALELKKDEERHAAD